MTRSYSLSGIYDDKSRPISQAVATAYNATDRNNLVAVETQQLIEGGCAFTALPDDVQVDINVIWGRSNSRWYYDVFAVTGTSIEEAIAKMHTQGTDTTLGTVTSDINMGGKKITNLAAPTNQTDVATKNYVDNIAMGGVQIDIFKRIWVPSGEKLYVDLDTGEMMCRVSEASAGTSTLIHQGFKVESSTVYVWELG